MSSDHGNAYIIRSGAGDDADDGWVRPEPAEAVVAETVEETTDLAADDLDDLEAYVDPDELAAVVGDGDADEVSFTVDGHAVVVTADGAVDVTPE